MRDKLLKGLNDSLERNHDLIEFKLLKPTNFMQLGDITALSLVCELLEIEEIAPVFEGNIIVRFE